MTRIPAVAGMTLEEKIGQLFVAVFFGDRAGECDAEDREKNERLCGGKSGADLVARYKLGGVVLYSWTGNLRSPEQVAELSDGLQRAALSASGIPLVIASDHETGVVKRLGPPATQLPGQMALAAVDDPELAREVGRLIGAEVRAIGINQVYAPVCDVAVNPANPLGVRSFGDSPQRTSELSAALVQGLQEHVAATAKHFPGHGATATDSHLGLPVCSTDLREWESWESPPFAACIAAGVDSVMTGHVVAPALDHVKGPATFSEMIIKDVLRERLGFRGVVVSDALDMAALDSFSTEHRAVLAVKAGCDMLLKLDDLPRAINAVTAAVQAGQIPEEQIDASVGRVLRMKERIGLFSAPYADHPGQVGAAHHRDLADTVVSRSITVVRDLARLLPLSGPPLVVGENARVVHVVADRLGAGRHVLDEERNLLPAAADRLVLAVTGGRNHLLPVAMRRLSGPSVLLSVGDPREIELFAQTPTVVASYSADEPSLLASADVLFGRAPASGTLPIRLR